MRCDDGGYYVVKFQNNPQHLRILANEMLGAGLAARLGLPVPRTEIVEVSRDLIELTADLVVQLGRGQTPCRPGRQFGSRYPSDPTRQVAHDFLPDQQLREVVNLADFTGMLAYDKWTCNTNGRQAIFFVESGQSLYQAMMIDQGFCFNAGEWNLRMRRCAAFIYAMACTGWLPGSIPLSPGSAGSSALPKPCLERLPRRYLRNGTMTITKHWANCSSGSISGESGSAS